MLELQIGTVGFVPSFVKYCKVTIMGNLKFRFKTRAKQINTEFFFSCFSDVAYERSPIFSMTSVKQLSESRSIHRVKIRSAFTPKVVNSII